MRTRFIAGNWKMFKTVQEATFYAKELRALVKDIDDVRAVIAPPYTAIHACAEALRREGGRVATFDFPGYGGFTLSQHRSGAQRLSSTATDQRRRGCRACSRR